jgi:predicted peptidase
MMMRVVALFLLLVPSLSASDDVDGFVARVYPRASAKKVMPYRLFVPPSYTKEQRYPLVLWLHGAGGAGTDNLAQISGDQIRGTRIWTNPVNQAEYPAFVLVPQSPGNWIEYVDRLSPELRMVVGILESVTAEFNIDPERIYVAGQSDGAYATWNLISQRPDLFAAAIPLCGGGDSRSAKQLAKMPVWVFHGTRDDVIPVSESRKMIAAIQKAGGRPRYTEYRDAGHDIWTRAFSEPEIVSWLFAQHK